MYCICIHENTWPRISISCFGRFDQDMAFSSVNTSEKQAKYKQEEQKHSFQPSWQSQRPWLSFVSVFSVSADSCNYGHDVLGDF